MSVRYRGLRRACGPPANAKTEMGRHWSIMEATLLVIVARRASWSCKPRASRAAHTGEMSETVDRTAVTLTFGPALIAADSRA
jgi:hypothetical protein